MLVATLLLAAAPQQASELDPAALRALVAPDAAETAWARIPWRIDLWDARVEAARVGKPLLLWEMDRHPLGCT